MQATKCNGNCYRTCNHDVMVYLLNEDSTCFPTLVPYLCLASVGVWEVSLGCEFLRGSMCADGMGCGRTWVRWVLRGTGTASGRPGVP